MGAGAVIVSVDYRLAPSIPIPQPSKTLGPQRYGLPNRVPASAPTAPGWPSPGIRLAAPSPR
ncbi:putative carboxylesterase Est2 [Mycobacterium kansasii]|uniref:Putative carboxylesterase Est2 n=1 Tax=Mycobacterium kansasii TaxID=1768 RepID=A0A1V3WDK4_MYCKA|nr:putative carboxylesterase Est2 [Mycobacterium kansasii]